MLEYLTSEVEVWLVYDVISAVIVVSFVYLCPLRASLHRYASAWQAHVISCCQLLPQPQRHGLITYRTAAYGAEHLASAGIYR